MKKEEKYIFFVNENDKLDVNPNLKKYITLNEKQADDVAKKGIDKFKAINGVLAEIVDCIVIRNHQI